MMKRRYPDPMERILLHSEPLAVPFPTEPSDYERTIRLRGTADEALFEASPVVAAGPGADPTFLPLVRAGLFYAMNALDDAHRLVQNASGDAAAYWHAMIHRREKDFENARYWLRRAGEQPSFAEMQARAALEGSANMARQSGWDPFLFVGLTEQLRFGAEELRAEVVTLQRVEFDVFFNYCFRRASGL